MYCNVTGIICVHVNAWYCLSGLRTFLLLMYEDDEESLSACAFMMRSMLADQPYSPVTSTQGACSRRLDTTTFSTLSSRTSLIRAQRPSVAAFCSSKLFFSSSDSAILRPCRCSCSGDEGDTIKRSIRR